MRYLASGMNGTNGAIGDLQMHGLTFTVGCDF